MAGEARHGSPNQHRTRGDTMLTGAVLGLLPGARLTEKRQDLLVTPTAQLAINGGSQPPDKRRAGGHGPTLADQVEHLSVTPLMPGILPGVMTIEGKGWGKYQAAVDRWAAIFGDYPAPVEPGRGGKPRLAARFPEWMMGLPAGWVTDVPGLTRTDHLKLIGNGVFPDQMAFGIRLLLTAICFPGGIVDGKGNEDEEIVTVISAEEMDSRAFARHFTRRHHEHLAGQTRLPGTISKAVEIVYRAYHRRLHEKEEGLGHVHESA